MAQVDSPDDIGAAGKHLVRRLIDEVMNAGRLDVLDEFYAPETVVAARRWIEPFRVAFPDAHMRSSHSWPKATWLRGGSGVPRHTWGRGVAARRPDVGSATSTRRTSSRSVAVESCRRGVWRTTTDAAGSWGCDCSVQPIPCGFFRRRLPEEAGITWRPRSLRHAPGSFT